MAQLPTFFNESGQVALANYDFTDIAEGTGNRVFYCFTSKPGGTLTYHLGQNAIEVGGVSGDTTDGATERRFLFSSNTATFSLSAFNTPQIIQGTAYLNFTIVTLGGYGGTATITASILKNSTTLATTTATAPTSATAVRTYNLSLTITQTDFAVGDVLKVAFAVNESGHVCLEHDPTNRSAGSSWLIGGKTHPAVDATENPTKCLAYIPFKLNLN
jgi:hypothetical protein